MRILFFLFISFYFSVGTIAQSMIQKCASALEHINAGYVQYGVNELKKLSNSNGIEAQYFMAICYENGIGVEQNKSEAFKLCRKTAERGLPDAMYRMAIYFQNGYAVEANARMAEEWFNRFQAKGGKLLLPDICAIYNEGIKHPENYAMNPNGGGMGNSGNGNMVAMQNNGNINSNNTIGSNNQTINNITIVQAAPTTVQPLQQPQPVVTPQPQKKTSDVDVNIPSSAQNNEHTFALIIANENYQDVAKVPNALNDGEVFAEYCKKTLGLPNSNVTLVKDATLNNMKREVRKLQQIAEAYKGSAKIIFYYAGHGIPDEVTKNAYLLPVDGFGTDTSTGLSLNELYTTLGSTPSQQVVVLLDACFSGTQRGDGMIASARGVAIKAKPNKAEGKMVIISAAQGDETAYPYAEKGHGLFTYYLLKKLQEAKGNVSLGDLSSFIKDNVSKKSIVVNGKSQTPSVNPSTALGDSWKKWTLK